MSRVFVAHERTLGRDVVVKVLPPEMAGEVSAERFEREIQLAARLQHPHIVPVLSAGTAAGSPYFVMPFITGESLRERIQRGGELPIGEAVRILRDLANALEYAHKQGVVHRDIKPENVLLTGGTAVVTDFGVAKALAAATGGDYAHTLTTQGMALGTPAYMSPEQVAADPATDHRADIYAWGVVAYELLTGTPPFTGRSMQALFAAHMAEDPAPIAQRRAGLPPMLSSLVMRSLAKRPADRPQRAEEIVRALDEIGGSSVVTPVASVGVGQRKLPRLRPITLVGLGIVILAGIGVAYFMSRNRPRAAASAATVKTIAVLPFLAGAGSDEYFAEGMSDELSAALGKVPGIQVASRTSTFAFKGPSVDIRDVGKRLRVQAVLEGSVRRAANRLRVTAQLTDASSGLSLWSDSYEREVQEVFAVQDDIARAIASALQVRLASASAAPIETHGTHDLAAYDLYLRGRYFWYRRGAEGLRQAISLLEQAVASDPQFAVAHAALASAYVLLPEYSDIEPREMNDRAARAADRALALDSTLAEAYVARGLVRVHAWDWLAAEQAYRTALRLDPRNATAHQWYGELLYELGRMPESVAQMRQASELDPLAPVPTLALAYALTVARDPQQAIPAGKRSLELAPRLGIAHRVLAFAYLAAGDSLRAYKEIKTASELDPELALRVGQVAFIAARVGKRDEALAAMRELDRRRRAGRVTPSAIMWVYLGLRDTVRAVAAFENAIEQHDALLTGYSLAADDVFDIMRGTAGFRRGIERMGLTPAVGAQVR